VRELVRKEILGASERKVLEAYLKGERLKGYTVLLTRVRQLGLRAIIEGCERDLVLLKSLLKRESQREQG
jgi:hypothetical protein